MNPRLVLDPDLFCKHIFFSMIIFIAVNISQLHYFSTDNADYSGTTSRSRNEFPWNDRFFDIK